MIIIQLLVIILYRIIKYIYLIIPGLYYQKISLYKLSLKTYLKGQLDL